VTGIPLRRRAFAALFTVLLALCLLVFVVFGCIRPPLPRAADLAGRLGTAAILLAVALTARRAARFRRYAPVLCALFVALCAMSIDYYLLLGQRVARAAGVVSATPRGLAVDKLGSSFTIAAVVVGLTLASGDTLASLRIRAGRLALGLAVGVSTFALGAAACMPIAGLLFRGDGLSLARVLPWAPWLLLFVLANGAAEELLFRGLFLGRLEPLLGRFPSNLLIAVPFSIMHYGVHYTSTELGFLVALVPLALAWGWLMQRTDSIWGSVLFHAGMDIPVAVGLFSSLPGP
jgi:membrane protease YdiL (CAAX protease family)